MNYSEMCSYLFRLERKTVTIKGKEVNGKDKGRTTIRYVFLVILKDSSEVSTDKRGFNVVITSV